jgi:hypothetical protein
MAKKIDYNEITKNLFIGTDTSALIVQRTDGKLIHRGVLLDKSQSHAILEMASTIKQIPVTTDLIEEVKRVGAKKLYDECRNLEDLYFAKGILYAMDIFEQKMNNLARQAQ